MGVKLPISKITIMYGRLNKNQFLLGMVTHGYNPSYSGGEDWDNSGLRPAQA
jgi:hypothetical protein